MINKFRIMWFWCVAFGVIIWNTIRGRHWHSIRVDFHWKDDGDKTIRKQLIARRSTQGLDIFWQDLGRWS